METVKEWLESIENIVLKDKALKAWDNQRYLGASDEADSLKDAVDRIVWDRTPEGFEFWENYFDTL